MVRFMVDSLFLTLTKENMMFAKLKTFFSGLSYAWKYRDVIRNVTTAWSQFPGWNDSELLRLWIRPLVQNATILTALTKT